MGYSEAACQICGAFFNIARIRRADEPRSAAWVYYGENHVDAVGTLSQCGRQSGCLLVDRRVPESEEVARNPWKEPKSETVVREDEEEDGGAEFAENAQDSDEGDDEPDLDEFEDYMDAEHIAGPGCKAMNGYSGHRLTLEEMKHCRVMQCLVRKTPHHGAFQPAPDDEAFELKEDFFRSGLHDGMPEAEDPFCPVTPARHGTNDPNPTNGMLKSQYIDNMDACMPFHPWCLEIFKRASMERTGEVDMAGLWGWYENEADFQVFIDFPRKGPTGRLAQQYWYHRNMDDWVVCNPLYIPGLESILQTAISNDPAVDTGKGAFNIPSSQLQSAPNETDPFTTLPTELRLMIVHHLPSEDIASLRLSSRNFRQLPISLWHHLLQTEMPWFWEASTSNTLDTYSFWTTTTAAVLSENPIPAEKRKSVPIPNLLPSTRTNWHTLYLALKSKRCTRELRGLRNRHRIWVDCQEILNRIESYRERGEIPVEDLQAIVDRRYEETRRRNQERYAQRKQLGAHAAGV